MFSGLWRVTLDGASWRAAVRIRYGSGGGWGIPFSNHTLQITLGGIGEKPGVGDQRVEIREYLSVTLSFDHVIIDGASAARFTQRLKEMIENGYGLCDDLFS
jgi:pyruvate/2-oxoglutarate dehydrogenase complex dihydrolipoamide acyltransferase (E2) component